MKELLKKLKKEIITEISKIETNIERQIFWVFCVNNWEETKKIRLRFISIEAGLINSSQDKRIMILEKVVILKKKKISK